VSGGASCVVAGFGTPALQRLARLIDDQNKDEEP